jgi:hypothetical protein
MAMDVLWCLIIITNFSRSEPNKNWFENAKEYVFSKRGTFWFDFVSIVPLFTLENDLNLLHLARLNNLALALQPVG